jgi:hypothetical protein
MFIAFSQFSGYTARPMNRTAKNLAICSPLGAADRRFLVAPLAGKD